jgi:hypothetical protein
MKLEFSSYIFEKYLKIKLHENLSSGSLAVPRGRTDRQTDNMKLTVTACNFVNAPKNSF